MVKITGYVSKYLKEKPLSVKEYAPETRSAYEEYPELEGSESYDFTTVRKAWFDVPLRQKTLKEQVDQIDVLYSTPAKELIRNADNLKITKVIINRNKKALQIQTKNGMVMATGGFEKNSECLKII
ncbi:FAD-binding protein [Lactobacillus panisapium]|uniref:FAD-binding protein n=1 Tax=Lactobacillus panisapium TaxID=2012495 RepID=UPI00215D6499|nr:FAD-binding protein [Lactobacillus panisapium]